MSELTNAPRLKRPLSGEDDDDDVAADDTAGMVGAMSGAVMSAVPNADAEVIRARQRKRARERREIALALASADPLERPQFPPMPPPKPDEKPRAPFHRFVSLHKGDAQYVGVDAVRVAKLVSDLWLSANPLMKAEWKLQYDREVAEWQRNRGDGTAITPTADIDEFASAAKQRPTSLDPVFPRGPAIASMKAISNRHKVTRDAMLACVRAADLFTEFLVGATLQQTLKSPKVRILRQEDFAAVVRSHDRLQFVAVALANENVMKTTYKDSWMTAMQKRNGNKNQKDNAKRIESDAAAIHIDDDDDGGDDDGDDDDNDDEREDTHEADTHSTPQHHVSNAPAVPLPTSINMTTTGGPS